jgi:protein SCO1/2
MKLSSKTVGLALLLAGAASLGGAAMLSASQLETKVLAAPKPLPAVSLQDHAGRPFTTEHFRGRWSLVLLGFTHCPDVCPFTLHNLALVAERLSIRVSPERLPQVVFLAVDPERDAPVLADYVKHFNPEFVGITGGAEAIKALVDGLGGYVRIAGRRAGSTSYQVHHSTIVSVIDPQGRVHATLNPPMEPAAAAEFLVGLMRGGR